MRILLIYLYQRVVKDHTATYQSVTNEHILPSDGPANKKKKLERSLFEVQWKVYSELLFSSYYIVVLMFLSFSLSAGCPRRRPYNQKSQDQDDQSNVWSECRTALGPNRNTNCMQSSIYLQSVLIRPSTIDQLSSRKLSIYLATGYWLNRPQDLGSILGFLRICQPLDEEDFFKRLVLRPIKDASPAGIELMRALMAHVCIRRTKEVCSTHTCFLRRLLKHMYPDAGFKREYPCCPPTCMLPNAI